MQVIERQVLLRRGAQLPEQLRILGQTVNGGWLTLPEDAHKVERQVRAEGWHFFRLTEQVQASSFGVGKEVAFEAALRNALRKIGTSRNAAEVISVCHRPLFGLQFCWIRLAVRHIQPDMLFSIAPSVGMISPALHPERWISPSVHTEGLAA